eukprot:TRINITY_DN34336_c0_g1_i1.p1 TRINITY_DN34336_c0_g1~~TRINITY_DN34336_c0_g1_i1.p1  ORF type:complete len:112 (-),score=20.27 TRINITY_DN34336_c0_g1_i1:72-407(-)
MPHKWYHGRTGVVWNVSKRAIGVEVYKKVRERIRTKRIHVRVEHVRPSRCREEFLNRVEENEKKKKAAKDRIGEQLKRMPVGPRSSLTLENVKLETVAPIPYDVLKEGVLS